LAYYSIPKNKERLAKATRKRYRLNREKILLRHKLYRQKRRRLVIDKYGGKCVCCGETKLEFLSMDHVNGGGTKERLKMKSSSTEFYRQIVKEKFPIKYRVLCHNCNQSLGFYKYCPHNKEFK